MFFLKHEEPEDTPDESRSKRNTHEAQFLASLYRYLRLQGYSEKDITVLALYKDQVLLLRSLIKQVKCCWLSSLSRCLSLSLSLSRSLSLFLALALSLSLSLFLSLSLSPFFSLFRSAIAGVTVYSSRCSGHAVTAHRVDCLQQQQQ